MNSPKKARILFLTLPALLLVREEVSGGAAASVYDLRACALRLPPVVGGGGPEDEGGPAGPAGAGGRRRLLKVGYIFSTKKRLLCSYI